MLRVALTSQFEKILWSACSVVVAAMLVFPAPFLVQVLTVGPYTVYAQSATSTDDVIIEGDQGDQDGPFYDGSTDDYEGIDGECRAHSFDFGIAKWEWGEDAGTYIQKKEGDNSGFSTDVSGTATSSYWTADPALSGVIRKAGNTETVFPGGTEGTILADAQDISHLTFCGVDEAEYEPDPPAPVCGNAILEEGEMCDDGGAVDGDGCSAQCAPEVFSCSGIESGAGWFGEYFNYSREHEDMALSQALWPDETHGDPLSSDAAWDADWFDPQYFAFSRTDADLAFGEDFFPLDIASEELDHGGTSDVGDHEFHFGAHWRARASGAAGEYPFTLTSDDDAWVYLDGALVAALPGVHAPQTATGTISFTGNHIVDVFFAERHTVRSHLAFTIEGDLSYTPFSEGCEPRVRVCKVEDLEGNGPSEGGAPVSGWRVAAFDAADPSREVDDGFRLNLIQDGRTAADGCFLFDDLPVGKVGFVEEKRSGWSMVDLGLSGDAREARLSETFPEFEGATTTPLDSFFDAYADIDVSHGENPDIVFTNHNLQYCGDGTVNQEWEQCDGTSGCTDQCQLEGNSQCRDLVLARIMVDEVLHEGDGAVTNDVYVGSQFNVLPSGTWFPLFWNGSSFTDPDIAGYEDVSGLAVERQDGRIRVVLHGSRTRSDLEHARGTIEFSNARIQSLASDNENGLGASHKLERAFDGKMEVHPGHDEVATTSPHSLSYWLTVDTADDGFFVDWDIIEDCNGICGFVFEDANQNGMFDVKEQALSGWNIELLQGPLSATTTPLQPQETTEAGYCFVDLTPGEYTVREVFMPGWATTTPDIVPVSFAGEGQVHVDFGNVRLPSIGGVKFFDTNQNGIFDESELGLSDWTIQLFADPVNASSTPLTEEITRDDGSFTFEGLQPGTYTLVEVNKRGWVQTTPNSPEHFSFTVGPGDRIENAYFGNFTATSTVRGLKYEDGNGDGARGEGEAGLSGWEIRLFSEIAGGRSLFATTTTCGGNFSCSEGEAGSFQFNDVPTGIYNMQEAMQDAYEMTEPARSGGYVILLGSHGVDDTDPFPLILGPESGPFAIQEFAVGSRDFSYVEEALLDFSGDGVTNTTDARLAERARDGEISWSGLKDMRNSGAWSDVIRVAASGDANGLAFGNALTELVISNENSGTPSETEATVTWDTNISAASRVVYGTTSVSVLGASPLYGYGTSTPEDAAEITHHTVVLSGLEHDTEYFWRAVSRNTSGEAVGEEEQTFTTQAFGQGGSEEGDGEDGDTDDGGTDGGGGGGGGGGTIVGLYGGTGGAFGASPASQPIEAPTVPPSEEAPFSEPIRDGGDVGEPGVAPSLQDGERGADTGDVDIDAASAATTDIGQFAALSFFGLSYQCNWWITLLAIVVLLAVVLYFYHKHDRRREAVIGGIIGLVLFWVVGSLSCSWLLALLALIVVFLIGWDLRQRDGDGQPPSQSEMFTFTPRDTSPPSSSSQSEDEAR